MSDPVVPVERGLRATVRMAAGINIGDEPDTRTLFGRVRHTLSDRIETISDRLSALARPITTPFRRTGRAPSRGAAVLRHAGVGLAAGTAVVACGFVAIAVQAVITAPAPVEELLAVEVIAAKADRLPLPVRTAAVAATLDAATPADAPAPTTADGTGDASQGGTFATAAVPTMAFASADAHDGTGPAAIDRVLEAPAIASMAKAGEEADDEAVVPVVPPTPRPRPAVLPVPRPRPLLLASLTPSTHGATGVPVEAAPAPPAAPEPRPSNSALGFFSSPADPVKPPARTRIDTPFGVPYVLQTGSVETACLKPELVDVLRRIEDRYHQKVVITSGFRDRGRQGSLHRQCAAADIQVNGIAAGDLASFARTIPGIGGVGTYCHPNMIHVDIGTPRDWKYGCGSYFAMRGTPGKWGRVPATMAKAQGTGVPQAVANDAQDEE